MIETFAKWLRRSVFLIVAMPFVLAGLGWVAMSYFDREVVADAPAQSAIPFAVEPKMVRSNSKIEGAAMQTRRKAMTFELAERDRHLVDSCTTFGYRAEAATVLSYVEPFGALKDMGAPLCIRTVRDGKRLDHFILGRDKLYFVSFSGT